MTTAFRAIALALSAALLAFGVPARADPAKAAATIRATPALWVARGKDSTVYLFGTIHLLDPAEDWRTPTLQRAFQASSELWLEVPFPTSPNSEEADRIRKIAKSLAMTTDGPGLTSRLTPAEVAQLAAVLHAPADRLDRLRPWFAAVMASAKLAEQLGLSATSGADYALDHDAVARGMPVHGFETAEQQFHFFADLTPAEELDYLRQTLAEASEGGALFEEMERDWLGGDDAALTKLAVGRMKARWPLFYRRFDVDRNRRWLSQIEAMLATPGVRFVAVGEGHLLGPDGVPALLRKDGWQVERVR